MNVVCDSSDFLFLGEGLLNKNIKTWSEFQNDFWKDGLRKNTRNKALTKFCIVHGKYFIIGTKTVYVFDFERDLT